MNVAALAHRLEVDSKLVGYVLFHGLAPGGDRASRGRGNARLFTLSEAFAIALAVRLFAGGLRQPFVKGLLRGLVERAADLEPLLAKAPGPEEVMLFEVADGANVRMRRPRPGSGGALDEPPWTALAGGGEMHRAYRPGVVTSIDLADIVRRLRSDPPTKGPDA